MMFEAVLHVVFAEFPTATVITIMHLNNTIGKAPLSHVLNTILFCFICFIQRKSTLRTKEGFLVDIRFCLISAWLLYAEHIKNGVIIYAGLLIFVGPFLCSPDIGRIWATLFGIGNMCLLIGLVALEGRPNTEKDPSMFLFVINHLLLMIGVNNDVRLFHEALGPFTLMIVFCSIEATITNSFNDVIPTAKILTLVIAALNICILPLDLLPVGIISTMYSAA